LNSTQASGGTGNAAIATDLSYVMEGVDNAIAIYSAVSGNKLYGPYAPSSFFAPSTMPVTCLPTHKCITTPCATTGSWCIWRSRPATPSPTSMSP
jgi:hypothetical protein